MANNIAVKITADIVDLTAKRAILSSELKAATSDLNNFAKTAKTAGSKELSASMLASAEAVAKTRAQVKLLDTEMKSLGSGNTSGFTKAFASLEQGASQAGTARLGAFGAALGAIGPEGIAAGIGLGAMAIAAEKAVKAAEWAEQLKRSADTLGMTTTQLQEFDFVLNAMGIDVDKGREALGGLEKAIGLVMEGAARKQLLAQFVEVMKIKPEDLRGWGTLEQQLPHILDALAKLDPEERAASFAKLKIDPEVGNSMIQARGHLSDLIDMAKKYGIVVDEDVVSQSGEAADKMRAWKAIIDGELRVAFINLAPAIGSFAHAVADALKWINDLAAAMDRFDGVAKTFVTAQGIQDALAPKVKPKELVAPTTKKHKGGDDVVQKWAETLHAQEVASNDFFGDQTAKELAFWQSKLALTKKGSKDWLEVQSKIFDAQKSLAHKAYDEHLAAMNEQLGADKENWAKEQADWNAKLDFIAAHFGKESKEYHDAHREFEAAEREHQHVMAQIAKDGANERLEALKSQLATDHSIREENARSAESLINEKASGTPLVGEIRAAQQIRALHQQNAQQDIAEAQQVYAQENAIREQTIAAELAAGGKESAAYNAAMRAKELADQQFFDKHRQLENQMVNQDIADQQKIRSAWHSAIDPMIQTTGAQIKGLVMGTETWGQALQNIEGEAIQLIVDALEKMVEQWIVGMLTGGAATQASAKVGVLAQAGLAGAGGVASMAAAPFPIDLSAPAFGADMFAAALSLGAFAQGTNEVPDDMVAQIHAGERIIPAADNRALMSAISNDNRSSSSTGDTHNHYDLSSSVTGGRDDVIDALKGRTSDLARLLKDMHRSGHIRLAAE